MYFGKLLFGALIAASVTAVVASPANAADFRVIPSKDGAPSGIILSGDIVPGDAEKFSLIAANQPNAVVFLSSNGGALASAIEIGKVIKIREYSTAVYNGSYCASSCALIWLSGSRRVIYNGGKVGFHASYKDVGGKFIEVGVGNALVGHYLSQLGYDRRAVIFVTSAPPKSISWLTEENKEKAGISFETFTAQEEKNNVTDVPELSDLLGDGQDSRLRAAFDGNSKASRNVKYLAGAILAAGYKAEFDNKDPKIPKIMTGVGGNNFIISFSHCINIDCDYAEIIGLWSMVDQEKANIAFKQFAIEENFPSVLYTKSDQTLAVYHYVILGKEGIFPNTLIDNPEYLARDFSAVGKLMVNP